ncbi:MAG: flagellar type III secretion system pore protein FliP [Thermoleophilia bacterium]|nr:flagellar type III secretion system pore protein FliP [Thermoleophilia bacterium]
MAQLLTRHIAARLAAIVLLALVLVAALGATNASAVTVPATPTKAAAPASPSTGGKNIGISIDTGASGSASSAIQVLVVLTILSIAPSILIMMTGFTRILIVLGFVRNALGTPTMPPNQVLVGLSMFLTLFVMFPVFQTINDTAVKPFTDHKITQQQAIDNAQKPLRKFMFQQVDQQDLALFVKLADVQRPKTRADVPTYVLIPAFLISELKTAFQIGFLIFVPFLIIDMIVASTLMSMGMIMLPPVMISLPFKILLFVLVDGWGLTIQSLVASFGGSG